MVKPAMAGSCINDSLSCSTNNNNESSRKMYKGVRKRKWGKWVSEIRLPNSRERIWLGSYDTQEKAARAFDAALYCLRGKTATFNFPDTPHNLETNVVAPNHCLSPHEIQDVAAKFANNDPPITETSATSQDQEPSLLSQSAANSFGLSNNNSLDELDTTDWTFLDMLDEFNSSDFGPQKMNPGEFLCCSTQAPLIFQDINGDQIEGDHDHDHDAFSNHSLLWSWSF